MAAKKLDAKVLLRRFGRAEERWGMWRSILQDCYEYASPMRESFSFQAPGQKKNRAIIDSTAIDGLPKYASSMISSVMPSWSQWIELIAGSDIDEQEKTRIDKALESATKTLFAELNNSNLYTELHPAFIDYGIGTGAILIEEMSFGDDQILKFTNIPLSELYLEPAYGRHAVDNVWRKYKVEPELIKLTWPNAEIPSELQAKIDKKNGTPVDLVMGMIKDETSGKFCQVVMYGKHLIFSQEFTRKRLIVFRNCVSPGETYGRGPIMQVLPDIMTVNKVKEFVLQNAALQISGVYTGVSDSIFNPYTVRIAPGVVIPVSSNNSANPSLAELKRSGDIQLGELIIADLQNNIRKALMIDFLGDVGDPVKSATEQMIRRQEALEQRGASIGRLYTELINPLIAACVEILQNRGLLPKFNVDSKEVKIKAVSPIAKAENIEDYQNLQNWLAGMQALQPEVILASVKMEDIPKYTAEKLGVPVSLIREEAEREEIMNNIMQQAQGATNDEQSV